MKDLLHKVISVRMCFCIGGLCFVVLMLSAFMIIWQSSSLKSDMNALSVRDSEFLINAEKDLESANVRLKDHNDSIVEVIRCNQLQLLRQQSLLVDDFRQEMNNNINKMNTWIAYAVGVISLMGVFIPLAMQFKSTSETKEELKNFKEKFEGLDESLEVSKNKLETSVQSETDACIKDCTDRCEKAIKSLETEKRIQLFWSRFLCFERGYNDNLMCEQHDRDLLMMHIGNRMMESYENMINSIWEENKLSEEDRVQIVTGLIMLNRLVVTVRNAREHRVRKRDLNGISDEIRDILVELSFGMQNPWMFRDARQRLDQLHKRIHQLRLFTDFPPDADEGK